MKLPFGLELNRFAAPEKRAAPPKEGVDAVIARAANSLDWLPNPSKLIERKGMEELLEMMTDDVIAAVSAMKADAILSPGYEFLPPVGNDSESEAKVAFGYYMIDHAVGSWNNKMRHLLTAHSFGFAWASIVLGRVTEDGDFKGLVTLQELRGKSPFNLKFEVDEFDRVTKLLNYPQGSYGEPQPLDLDWIALYTSRGIFENPYGTSELEPCYRWYLIKKHLLRFQIVALERMAGGFRHLKFPRDIDKAEKEKYQEMIKNMGSDTGLATPMDIEFSILEAKGAGWIAYERAIDQCNRAMSGAMLMPNRIGIGAADFSSGSFALAQAQLNVYLMHLRNLADELSDVVQDQVIRPIFGLNFEGEPPRFRIKDFDTMDKVAIARMWIAAMSGGSITNTGILEENYLRALLGGPETTAEQIQSVEEEETPPEETLPPEPEDSEDPENPEPESDDLNELRRHVRLPEIERRVDFTAIEKGLDRIEAQLEVDLDSVMSDILRDTQKTIKNKQIIQGRDTGAVDRFELSRVGKLRDVFVGGLFAAFVLGKVEAFKTINKAHSEAGIDSFVRTYSAPKDLPVSLTTAEAKKILIAMQIPVNAAELARLKHLAFNIAGVTRNQVLEEVKKALISGLNREPVWTENRIRAIFEKYKVSFRTKNGVDITPHRIRTIVRTETSRAFQWGQRAMYEDDYASKFIVGYEWVSTLDDDTSEYCEDMDGRITRPGEVPPPPAHPNCRSDQVPVFEWDRHTLSAPTTIQRMEGF